MNRHKEKIGRYLKSKWLRSPDMLAGKPTWLYCKRRDENGYAGRSFGKMRWPFNAGYEIHFLLAGPLHIEVVAHRVRKKLVARKVLSVFRWSTIISAQRMAIIGIH